ncbi:MAG: hypothetical protein H5U07_10470 [Candidatus Aminicenantes bacterium]|nr:hypothetical protein [Candidatus Aminicenantes bacterium]
MKASQKIWFFIFVLIVPLLIRAQEISPRETASRINYEQENIRSVLVRVLKQGTFVNDLAADDFEVLENGQPCEIEAVYLIDGFNLNRLTEKKRFSLSLNKNYFVVVQANEYDRKFGEAVDLLVNKYFQPGDTLTLITPLKVYRFRPEILTSRPRNMISKELQNMLRSDIIQGNREYNNLLKDLRRITRAMVSYGGERAGVEYEVESDLDATTEGFSMEFLLPRYKETLEKLDRLRLVDQRRFLEFSGSLKQTPGQNVVIFYYQREFRPELSPRLINQMMSIYQDYPHILSMLMELFQFYKREVKLDKEVISRALADSAAVFNFIYLDKKPDKISGVVMNEQSEDVYEALKQAAEYTGGISDNTSNAVEALKTSMENIAQYYLIFYATEPGPLETGFREIKVRLKNKPDFQVRHRRGYYQ